MARSFRELGTEISRRFAEIEQSIRTEALTDIGDELIEEMEERVPVDTGNLRNSIERVGTTVRVGAGYAGIIEFGTERTPQQPYVQPSIEELRRTFTFTRYIIR